MIPITVIIVTFPVDASVAPLLLLLELPLALPLVLLLEEIPPLLLLIASSTCHNTLYVCGMGSNVTLGEAMGYEDEAIHIHPIYLVDLLL
jgi:hypothetical protein